MLFVQVFPKLRFRAEEDVNNEPWYRQQVLYIPWRNENMVAENATWKDSYDFHSTVIEEARARVSFLDTVDSVHTVEESINESDSESRSILQHINDEWMNISCMMPNSVAGSVELGHREIDLEYDWGSSCIIKDRSSGSVSKLSAFLQDAKSSDFEKSSYVNVSNVSFNSEQTAILNLLQDQINVVNGLANESDVPRRLIVQGKAGKMICFDVFLKVLCNEEMASNFVCVCFRHWQKSHN